MIRSVVIIAILAVLMIGAVIYGIVESGSPFETRDKKFDAQRTNDLTNLTYAIQGYYQTHAQLPTSLDVIKDDPANSYYSKSLTDPQTHKAYEYIPGQGASYQLCANFSTASPKDNNSSLSDVYTFSNQFKHDKGRVCFTLSASYEGAAGIPLINSTSNPIIFGKVYLDSNKNGKKDADEEGYFGAKIGQFKSGSGFITATNKDGSYTFSNLPTDYTSTIALQLPKGYVSSDPHFNSGFVNVIVKTSSVSTNLDFGINPELAPQTIDDKKDYQVSGTVFIDDNRNGIKDTTEKGFTCTKDCIKSTLGTGLLLSINKWTDDFSSTTGYGGGLATNPSGFYSTQDTQNSYKNLPSGIYQLSITSFPEGYEPTTPPDIFFNLSSDKVVDFGIAPLNK